MLKFLLVGWCLFAAGIYTVKGQPNGDSQYAPIYIDHTVHTLSATDWDVNFRGNHRAIVFVKGFSNGGVRVNIPWRRPDPYPEKKKVVVVDAATGKEIPNVYVKSITNEAGEIAFEPVTVPGKYEIYYLPYTFRRLAADARYGEPWNDYIAPQYDPDKAWADTVGRDFNNLPTVKVLRFEARKQFDLFTSMGLIATGAEEGQLIKKANGDFMLFPEDRAYPIRLTDRLPVRWVQNKYPPLFTGNALRNEYYTFQVGVFAYKKDISKVAVSFSDLINKATGQLLSADSLTCFNLGGTNWDGKPISFKINIPKGNVQALWMGVSVPQNIKAGNYEGWLTISAENGKSQKIKVVIQVGNEILPDRGDADLWRHSRLRWLNSALGLNDELIPPFKALKRAGQTLNAGDNKQLVLNNRGLPGQITTNAIDLFSAPPSLTVTTAGHDLNLTPGPIKFIDSDGKISWANEWYSSQCTIASIGELGFDGTINYKFTINAPQQIKLDNIALKLRFKNKDVPYMMGIGLEGGNLPLLPYKWGWKGPWDSFWIGNVNAGIHVEFQKSAYNGPLLNDYKPAPPAGWANDGKGTVIVIREDSTIVVTANTGEHDISAVNKLELGLKLLITPVKDINTKKHFSERYYQGNPLNVKIAADEGANVINIHHNTTLNPFINYPFIVRDSLKAYIAQQHEAGRRVKLYYTIRELSDHTVELYALKSLGTEIFPFGPGGGTPWLWEHLNTGYKAAWYSPSKDQTADASIVMNGFSRWINYYIEGLRWMEQQYKIDGLYLDDVAYDREVIERLRRVLLQNNPNALLDLHSNNNYSVGPANQYASFFPYLDRIWFGESFKYNKMSSDQWLVQFSGIPFGVMSEMLEGGGNRWLGMVYGTTVRHSWGAVSPAPVWKFWDDFDIKDAKMYGYWDDACPVINDNKDVKITVYAHADQLLLAIGNFSDTVQYVTPRFKAGITGFSSNNISINAPAIKDYQPVETFQPGEQIRIDPKKGWLLVISKKNN
jgi:hypothetical protein